MSSSSENNVFIDQAIKINIFFVSCNNGIHNNYTNENLSQNCLLISNSQKIKIYNLLIFNSLGKNNALGLILQNEKPIFDSYVIIKIFQDLLFIKL